MRLRALRRTYPDGRAWMERQPSTIGWVLLAALLATLLTWWQSKSVQRAEPHGSPAMHRASTDEVELEFVQDP